MRVLLTGFEPFGGRSVNPSAEVVRALTGVEFGGEPLRTAILPVADEQGPRRLLAAVRQHDPRAVLCLGQAARRSAVSIERVGVNLKTSDECGREPVRPGQQADAPHNVAPAQTLAAVETPVVPGGPAAYFTTLPARAIYAALLSAGIPAELSRDAGTYLCNQITYSLLHHIAGTQLPCAAGFIHLPLLPEQAATMHPPAPSMSLDTMCRAVQIAIETVIAPEEPRLA